MKKIFNLIKPEKVPLLIISAVYILLIYFTWGKYGELFAFDNAREIYAPYLVSKGLLLYRDIHYFYGPIVPYLFALIIKIFGFHLYVYYLTGLFLTTICLFSIYTLSRYVLNQFGSSIVALLFLSQLAFFNSGMNTYVLPYSYAAVVSIMLMILLAITLLSHFNNPEKKYYLWLGVLICILTFFTKHDYVGSSVVTFIIYILAFHLKKTEFNKSDTLAVKAKKYLKTLPHKDIFLYLSAIVLLPLTIYYFIGNIAGQKVLVQSLLPFNILHNPAEKVFIRDVCKGSFSISNLLELIYYSIVSAIIIMGITFAIYGLISFYRNCQSKKNFKLTLILTIIILPLLLISYEGKSLITILLISIISNAKYIYSGINIWIILITIYLILNIKKSGYQSVLLLTVICLLSGYRMFYNLQLDLYAFYYLPVYLIVFVFALLNIIPDLIFKEKSSSELYKHSAKITLVILVITYTLLTIGIYKNKNVEISTDFGTFKTIPPHKPIYDRMIKISEYIKENTKKSDTILYYPHNILAYVLSDRFPASSYYYLVAVTVVTEKQEHKIIKDIKKNKPALIIISNEKFSTYQLGDFGSRDFAPLVYSYIKNNYKSIKVIPFVSRTKKNLNLKIYVPKGKEK